MRIATLVLVLSSAAFMAAAPQGPSSTAGSAPTFSRDVAPIVYSKCASCHRPGEVAPMSLLSYREVRPWAAAIREQVRTRAMPPWHADRQYGRFRNDLSLSTSEIDTIVGWVDSGARSGRRRSSGTISSPPSWDSTRDRVSRSETSACSRSP